MRMKGLLACGVAAALGLFAVAGCASGGNDVELADTGSDWAATYPVHAANAEDGAGLASYHAALGQECDSCHQGDLAAQVTEATGGEGEPDCTSTFYDDTATCLSSDCHVSWETLAERTADLGDYNPHDSIHGTIEDCNECHKGHSEQVDICGQCHPNGGQEMTA